MTHQRERADAALRRLAGGLVASCQAREDNPLHGPLFMAAMAQAAIRGGAVGIRADGEDDIAAIRSALGSTVPIMGIRKVKQPDGSLFITPAAESARAVIAAGAELVALDGTPRRRPGGDSLRDVVAAIHAAGGAALADVDTPEHARYAIDCGVDAVGTTLSGYTPDSPKQDGPDFALLECLVSLSTVPVFAEGRIWTPEAARRALEIGALFVVVGTAITNPMAITARFVAALEPPSPPAATAPRGFPVPGPSEGEGRPPEPGAKDIETTSDVDTIPPLPRKGEGVRG
ncbi:MAG TPA: N-acetylmannosamine-6-phosphate 2-epimerase [Thermomicrobiales bacterium]